MTVLDWRDPVQVNRYGSAPCRHCGVGCLLLDDDGQPSHKVCAEHHADTHPDLPRSPRSDRRFEGRH